MNYLIGYTIFIIILLIILYLGVHYYVFWRLWYLFSIKQKIRHYCLLLFLMCIFPISSLIEKSVSNSFVRTFYVLSAIWVGTIFFLFCCLVVFEILNKLIKIPKYAAGVVIVMAAISITIFSIIIALVITTRTVTIPVEDIDKNYKIVHLSDIHIGTVHNSRYLKNIVKKVNHIDPDFVVITGDLFDGSGKLIDYNISSLNDIKVETFFVTGNHERYVGVDEVLSLLNKTKINILRNQVVNFEGLQIIGIDDSETEFENRNPSLNKITINKSIPTILLYHRPVGLDDANDVGVDLQLSGHTHHGQVFPFSLIVKLLYPRDYGLYTYKNTTLYVSQGVGTWGPPMRFLTRSEIVVINLVPK
ncbi:MAG: metallophosphoesterase [Candidatus Woesearchaeota archaeon]